MIQIQTGIQNGNGHALAGIAQLLPNRCHAGHLGGGVGHRQVGISNLAGIVHRADKDALDARQGGNGFQIAKLCFHNDGVGQVSKLRNHIQLLIVQHILFDGCDHVLLLLQQSIGQHLRYIVNRAVQLYGRSCFQSDEHVNQILSGILAGHLTQRPNILRKLSISQVNGSAIRNGGSPLAILEIQFFPVDYAGLIFSQGGATLCRQTLRERTAITLVTTLLHAGCRTGLHSGSSGSHDAENHAQGQQQC